MSEGEHIHLLLIEDEEYDVRRIRNTIRPFAERIVISDVVADGSAALEMLKTRRGRYDVVIMDFQIAGGLMGEQLIREIRRTEPLVEIVVVTKMTINVTDVDFANRLMQAGAFWYCTKYPGDIEDYIYQPTDFVLSIVNAFQKRQLEKEKNRSHRKLAVTVEKILAEREILGTSEVMQDLRKTVQKCAESAASVLIMGPSGAGKEFVAQNIHYRSSRRLENFVAINCGSLPSELVESELFGFEKGAFTGANTRRLGHFEHADHGTLFLDEVGELPPTVQVKLLRVLQEGEIVKIGRSDKVRVDVRVIAATNKNLIHEVEAGRFREDLFYRLNVLPIYVPALKDHPGDIPLYVDHFLGLLCKEQERPVPAVDHAAMERLRAYEWPGNVRQLKNLLQRLLFEESQMITAGRVDAGLGGQPVVQLRGHEFSLSFSTADHLLSWRQLERTVREQYFGFVRKHSSSDADAAKKLGLAPSNFHRMLKELGLK